MSISFQFPTRLSSFPPPPTYLPTCLFMWVPQSVLVSQIRCNHNHSFDTANKKPTQLPGICFTQLLLVLAPSSLENQGPYYMGDLA